MATADTNILRDPLQGFDIRVSSFEADASSGPKRLVGAFNTFMWRVINQVEAYVSLGQRIPRMLDGEVMAVWSLEQGLVNFNIVENTFGSAFAKAFAKGRNNVIPRQKRLSFLVEAGLGTTIPDGDTPMGQAGFNLGGTDTYNMAIKLNYCRTDTVTFGVSPGRAIAGNSWQGTCEGVDDGTK